MKTHYQHYEQEHIKALLIGRKVVTVDWKNSQLVLDDGKILKIHPNDGGCSCGAGDYYLTELNKCDNMILNVEFDCVNRSEGGEPDQAYQIFVYAENQAIKMMEVEGNDGNGYYGTGYWIEVTE